MNNITYIHISYCCPTYFTKITHSLTNIFFYLICSNQISQHKKVFLVYKSKIDRVMNKEKKGWSEKIKCDREKKKK